MADKSVIRSLYAVIGTLGVMLAVFVVASHNPYTAMLLLFAIGTAARPRAALQTRSSTWLPTRRPWPPY